MIVDTKAFVSSLYNNWKVERDRWFPKRPTSKAMQAALAKFNSEVDRDMELLMEGLDAPLSRLARDRKAGRELDPASVRILQSWEKFHPAWCADRAREIVIITHREVRDYKWQMSKRMSWGQMNRRNKERLRQSVAPP